MSCVARWRPAAPARPGLRIRRSCVECEPAYRDGLGPSKSSRTSDQPPSWHSHVEGLIGLGGMGYVYKARDTRLGRHVAIKVLPPAFTGDADRLARFEREARTLAAVNRPNIATIYGLEQFDVSGGAGTRPYAASSSNLSTVRR